MEHKGGCRSAPLCSPARPFPSRYRQFLPLWLSPPPPLGAAQTLWSKLPVGGDFIAQRETPVKGATHGFAAMPLTGVSRCAFYESPTEQIAQRACSRHEPTGSRAEPWHIDFARQSIVCYTLPPPGNLSAALTYPVSRSQASDLMNLSTT